MRNTDSSWSIFDRVLEDDTAAYFDAFNDKVYASKPDLLGNSNPSHAVYVLKRFIDLAQRELRLYTGCLQQVSDRFGYEGLRIYSDPNLIESFRDFLSKSSQNSLKIVVEDEIDGSNGSHPLIECFKSIKSSGKSSGKVELRKIEKKLRDEMERLEANRHLVLVDNSFMRTEISHEKSAAILLFHDSENITPISNFFDETLWSRSTSIAI